MTTPSASPTPSGGRSREGSGPLEQTAVLAGSSTGLPEPTTASTGTRARPRPLVGRLLRNPTGVVPLGVLALLVLAALLAPVLAPSDPGTSDISSVLVPPGGEHLLGTDSSGRDVLSRLLFAARFSLAGAVVALVTAMVLGVSGGLLAGYFGRWVDTVWSAVVALLMALPGIVVLLAARAVIGPSLWYSMLVFGVLMSPAFFRLVYALVTGVRDELYVDAARVSGLSDSRIIRRHILIVVRAPLVIQAAIVTGVALAIQSGLEFLGLGDINVPTWGQMLNDGFANLYRAPGLITWPALSIGLTLVCLTLLASALRDELQRSSSAPRRRPRRAATAALDRVLRHDARDEDVDAADVLLRVQGLSVGYPAPDGGTTTVVHDVSLTVARGEVHGVVGESGSGKTQTAWSVLGLLPPGGRVVGGAMTFDGQPLDQMDGKQRRALRGRRIAYIPQEPMSNLDPAFTIGHQLVEPIRVVTGASRAAARRRALELLGEVGIPDPQRTFDAYPHQVSGGMAQRVLIAGAISCGPDLLVADEPTTALDVTVQAEVLDVLRDLQRRSGMAVVLVTHNFGVVADLCDRVTVMREGRVVETGPTRSVFADPQHPYTRELLGAVLHDTPPRGPLPPREPGSSPGSAGSGSSPRSARSGSSPRSARPDRSLGGVR